MMKPFEQVVLVARVLAAPTRLALLQVLGEDGRCLTDAARMVGISAATACYHAHILVAAGLATRTVRGRRVIYGWPRSRWQLVRVRTGPTTATSAVPKRSYGGDVSRRVSRGARWGLAALQKRSESARRG